jgi:hypothetical protein
MLDLFRNAEALALTAETREGETCGENLDE